MGEPKALLSIDGETFIDRLIRTFRACCGDVIAVLGADSETIRGKITRAGECRLVVNPTPELGQISSLQCGLRAVPAGCGGILFTPVDSPGVAVATVEQLQKAIGESFVVPRYDGRRGHPIGFRSRLTAEFFELDPAVDTAREVVHRHQGTTIYLDVDDPAIHWDIDDRAQYVRTLGTPVR